MLMILKHVFMRISHKSNAVLPTASLKINFSKLMCVFKKSEIVDFLYFTKALRSPVIKYIQSCLGPLFWLFWYSFYVSECNGHSQSIWYIENKLFNCACISFMATAYLKCGFWIVGTNEVLIIIWQTYSLRKEMLQC